MIQNCCSENVNTTTPDWCVLKFGGSLLNFEPATDQLQRWLTTRPEKRHVLIAGGGSEANRLRSNQHQLKLSDMQAHWQAIDIMDRHTRLLASQLGIPVCESIFELKSLAGHSLVAFLCGPWLRRRNVSCSWKVTSDSIAAFLAGELNTPQYAAELVLLKSSLPVAGKTTAGLVSDGFVDAYFESAITQSRLCRISVVNLRADPVSSLSFRQRADRRQSLDSR